ncbi:unnamed protein product, partial [Cyprideis torosa]
NYFLLCFSHSSEAITNEDVRLALEKHGLDAVTTSPVDILRNTGPANDESCEQFNRRCSPRHRRGYRGVVIVAPITTVAIAGCPVDGEAVSWAGIDHRKQEEEAGGCQPQEEAPEGCFPTTPNSSDLSRPPATTLEVDEEDLNRPEGGDTCELYFPPGGIAVGNPTDMESEGSGGREKERGMAAPPPPISVRLMTSYCDVSRPVEQRHTRYSVKGSNGRGEELFPASSGPHPPGRGGREGCVADWFPPDTRRGAAPSLSAVRNTFQSSVDRYGPSLMKTFIPRVSTGLPRTRQVNRAVATLGHVPTRVDPEEIKPRAEQEALRVINTAGVPPPLRSRQARRFGKLVYVSYGTVEDLEFVNRSVDLGNDSIALVRASTNTSMAKVAQVLQTYGFKGAAFYPDAKDYIQGFPLPHPHHGGPRAMPPSEFELPQGWGLPGNTPLMGSVVPDPGCRIPKPNRCSGIAKVQLDESRILLQLATLFPSPSLHLRSPRRGWPDLTIPCVSIPSAPAFHLLRMLRPSPNKTPPPEGFKGSFNVPYDIGPGFKGSDRWGRRMRKRLRMDRFRFQNLLLAEKLNV